MKLKVKEDCVVWYGERLYKTGETVDYKEDFVPAWGDVIEKKPRKQAEKTPEKTEALENNLTDNTDDETNDEGKLLTPETDTDSSDTITDDAALWVKYSELLDEAVSLGISYEPVGDLEISKKIEELQKLIEDKS